MTQRHRVFISYHHDDDQRHKETFLRLFGSEGADILVDCSVDTGDIQDGLKTETIRQKIRDEYIRDATVVIVLVGRETWQRRHVDWEISSGISDTKNNSRCGLLGILLPIYQLPNTWHHSLQTIPPRLYDNIKCKFAKLHDWPIRTAWPYRTAWPINAAWLTNTVWPTRTVLPTNATDVQGWIHTAFQQRNAIDPHNSRKMFGQNRSGDYWQD